MRKVIICLFSTVILISSCSDDLLDENPPNVIYAENLYSDLSGLEAGINGLYSLMRYEREGLNASSSLITDVTMSGTDMFAANHSGNGVSRVSVDWNERNKPDYDVYEGVFLWLYEIVNSSNEIIKNVEERSDIDWSGNELSEMENKDLILAEARVARAFAYRHLSYLWGDVPLNLNPSSDGIIRTDWERTPVEEVRRQVVKDLLFAEPIIPEEGSLTGRITKGAVQHYLAEIYLTLNKPDSTLFWSDKVVNNPAYALITQRYGVQADQDGVAFMTADRGGYGNGRSSLTKWALDNFDDPNDDRFSEYAIRKAFTYRDAAGNAPYPADNLPEGANYGDKIFLDWSEDITDDHNGIEEWPFSRKYDWADPIDPIGNRESFYDQIYLRAADTYLLKAEAEFRLGNTAAAANTINILRARSHAFNITAGDIDIDFILDERARELMVEEPRRYTLLRTGKWAERTMKYNNRGSDTIDPQRDILLPIPQSVIDSNLEKEMPQNPGF